MYLPTWYTCWVVLSGPRRDHREDAHSVLVGCHLIRLLDFHLLPPTLALYVSVAPCLNARTVFATLLSELAGHNNSHQVEVSSLVQPGSLLLLFWD